MSDTLGKEMKEFLDDLTTRDQRMMFAVLTMVHTADTKEQLDNDTEALLTTARKHLCQFAVLKYQQMDGLNTVMPYGTRKIDSFRTLTTESLGMLVVLDSILNRITQNRAKGKNTFIFIDEIYLLFQHEYSANFLFTLWKRVRKYCAYASIQNGTWYDNGFLFNVFMNAGQSATDQLRLNRNQLYNKDLSTWGGGAYTGTLNFYTRVRDVSAQ